MIHLENDKYYHIYNRGINSCNLFDTTGDYRRFLNLYNKYITPVADTYAWVLMANHFHFLIRIKDQNDIGLYKPLNNSNLPVCEASDSVKEITTNKSSDNVGLGDKTFKTPTPDKYFSHLFNAYAKYYNTRTDRHGSLFEKPFKRNLINNKNYFIRLVMYIHNNPIHHGFCNDLIEYPWSSYQACVSNKSTRLKRNEVIEWFGDVDNFKQLHRQKQDIINMEEWLGI